MLPLLGVLGAALAIYGVAEKTFEPALKAGARQKNSKEQAARFLVEALAYEAAHGKVADVVRRIPVKPGGGVMGYFQIKAGGSLNFVVVYTNGDIAMKAADKDEWDWYRSPGSLNRLYGYFRRNFNQSVKSVDGLKVNLVDFGDAAKEAVNLPEALEKIRP